MFAGLFSAVFFMAQFQQTVLGQSPLQAGLRLIPWTGTVLLVSPLAGALVDRIGERSLVVTGLLMQAAGFIWTAVLARTGLPYSQMVAPLILAETGISMRSRRYKTRRSAESRRAKSAGFGQVLDDVPA